MTKALWSQPLTVADRTFRNRVFLAPMSGVTDQPFRRLAHRFGAGAVVSEMVASRELVGGRRDVVRRADAADGSAHDAFDHLDLCYAGHQDAGHQDAGRPAGGAEATHRSATANVVQLAGTEAHWMSQGARAAVDLGAEILDINMGCPAREVTGKQSGSALMRDLDHATSLIEAVLEAVDVPVTLKMRLGWDHRSINAPDLARRAEHLGVALVTVHGRTRCQFYKGLADWTRIADVKAAVDIPVIVNGDIHSPLDAVAALRQSGADGVMVGRGAYGAPWVPARIAHYLTSGEDPGDPSLERQWHIARAHYDAMLEFYGGALGLRNARKHLGWYLERAGCRGDALKAWRRRLCTPTNPDIVRAGIDAFYEELCGTVRKPDLEIKAGGLAA